MQRPLVPLTIAMIAGIAVGYFLHFPDLPLFAGLIFIFFFMLFPAIRNSRGFLPLAASAFFILGILNINLSIYGLPDAKHIIHQISREKLTIEGVIVQDPEESPDGKVIIVAARNYIRENQDIPAEGLIMLSLPHINYPLKYGDLVRFRTRLRTPRNFNNPGSFDYEKQLRGRGILVQGRVTNASDIVLIRDGQGNFFKMGIEIFRSKIGKIIEENSATPEKEILMALLLGEKKQIPPPIRESFNRTGTSHILAISGLHVGMIASLFFFIVLLVMKASPYLLLKFNVIKVSSFFALLPVLLYAFIAGLGVSVIRAAIMVVVFLIAVLIRKERDLFNTLALAALILLLITPAALFDVSFQLSFAAVAALIFAVPVLSSLLSEREQGGIEGKVSLQRKIFRTIFLFIVVSLVATLGTLPLIAYYFNGFSTLSLPANCIVVPLMGMITLPVGVAVIIISPFSSALSALLVKTACFFVDLSLASIAYLSSLPGSYLTVTTPSLPEIICYYLLFTVIIMIVERKTAIDKGKPLLSLNFLKYALCALVIFFAAGYGYLSFKDNFRHDLRITAIDVGQGNSTLIRLPAGRNILIDGGGNPGGGSFDVGKYVLAPYLWRERIKELDIVVLTHPHPDHLRGLLYILENFQVREVWTNGYTADSDSYNKFLEVIGKRGIPHRIVGKGTLPVIINKVTIQALNPLPPSKRSSKKTDDGELNNTSLVLKLAFGKTSFLLTGDISASVEKDLLERGADVKTDVLFVPHHGSATSSTRPFLDRAKPRLAVISCGKDNVFRLPHPDVLKRYADLHAEVHRTDTDGAVTVTSDGNEVTVKTTVRGKGNKLSGQRTPRPLSGQG